MTENLTTPETVETIAAPSKFAVLKSKITREGLILGGIAAGAIIAGVHVLLKAQTQNDIVIEAVDATETEPAFIVISEVNPETPES